MKTAIKLECGGLSIDFERGDSETTADFTARVGAVISTVLGEPVKSWTLDEKNRDVSKYELLHLLESSGEDFFGLKIFVNLSTRKVADDTHDSRILRREVETYDYKTEAAIRTLEKAIRTRTAQLDPKGVETRQKYRQQIVDIYAAAGVTAIYLEERPNAYCSDWCCLNRPWFKVTSAIGHVEIGWRKSVISIDWKESAIKKNGEELFPSEATTRTATGIHAWGAEAATRYIKKLHEPAAGTL